ncbi:MAG: hypothetical protein ACK4N5_13540, partial [Myxococcales bacterium]
AKKDAETLFLQFGSASPDEYGEADRVKLAAALVKGARAAAKDPFIALGLLQRAVILNRTAEALTLLGQTEFEMDQRALGAQHLDEAIALDARYVDALLARAYVAERENEPALAVQLYQRALAAGAKGDVKKRLAKAEKAAQEAQRAVADLKQTEQRIETQIKLAAKSATRDWIDQIRLEDDADTERRRMAPGGVRKQEVENFVFTYQVGKTHPSELKEFERKLVKLLEKTYAFVTERLNHRVRQKTTVVLMSREEYAQRHAGHPMQNAAGYWDGRQIVINGGTEFNESFAGTMVHEFVHTAMTDIAGHGVLPRWLNEGIAENVRLAAQGLDGELEPHVKAHLARIKHGGGLPALASLDGNLLGMGQDVGVSYAVAAVAVKHLIRKSGYPAFISMAKGFGPSASTESLIQKHFQMSLKALEEAVQNDFK